MSLEKIQQFLKPELEETAAIIQSYLLQIDEPELKPLIEQTPFATGKRVRLLFMFLLARAAERGNKNLPYLAAAVEIFHLASLVHDDILDESRLRRNQKTLNARFGVKIALLWGDFLLTVFQRILIERRLFYAQKIFNRAAREMLGGQLEESLKSERFDLSLQEIVSIARKKTAALFVAIARLMRLSKEWQDFAENFGLLFQFSDDLLDLYGEKSGKELFQDLEEGKLTLPYYFLTQELPQMERALKSRDRQAIIEAAGKIDLLAKVEDYLKNYRHKLDQQIECGCVEPVASYLKMLVRFLTERRS